MKQPIFAMALAATCLGTASLIAADAPTNAPAPARIGVYDSRSIAVAYCGSPTFEKWLSTLRAERDQAKAEGNTNRVAKIEAEGRKRQQDMHVKGFGTAPVDDLLEQIKDQMPAIAKKAGVDLLVSKWDQKTLDKYPAAERVDVTMALIDAFKPNERQRKSAIEIQQHKPISPEEAAGIRD